MSRLSKRDNLKWSFIRAISQIGEGRYKIQYPKRIACKRESLMFGKLSQWREERKIQKGICRKALSSSQNSVLFDRIQVGRRWDVWDQQHVGSCSENKTRRYEENIYGYFQNHTIAMKTILAGLKKKCREIICEHF